MFSKKASSKSLSAGSTTLIANGTDLVGNIRFSGSLMIEGSVEGDISASVSDHAHVRVLERGTVKGEIRVPSIVINGTVNGDVFCSKHIELAANAVVNGNVHYELIEMTKGAQVNGNLVYSAATSDKSDLPVADTGLINQKAKLKVGELGSSTLN